MQPLTHVFSPEAIFAWGKWRMPWLWFLTSWVDEIRPFFFEIVTALNSILFKSFPSVFAISKQAMNILKQQLVLGVLMEKRPTPPPMSEALVHDVVFRGRLFFGEKKDAWYHGAWLQKNRPKVPSTKPANHRTHWFFMTSFHKDVKIVPKWRITYWGIWISPLKGR